MYIVIQIFIIRRHGASLKRSRILNRKTLNISFKMDLIFEQINRRKSVYKQYRCENNTGAKIILIIGIKKKTDRLVKNGLNFKSIRKLVTFFQKANLRVIYYKFYNIGYDKLGICGNRSPIYKIYKKDYDINNYIYNIINQKALKGRRCLHDLVKYDSYININ